MTILASHVEKKHVLVPTGKKTTKEKNGVIVEEEVYEEGEACCPSD